MIIKISFSILTWICISENLLWIGGSVVPQLPKQIETTIRFVRSESESEELIQLYYDQERNAITAVTGDVEERQTYIFLFDSDEWLQIKEAKCDVLPIPDVKSSLVAYFIDENKRKQIKDFGSFLYFDPHNKAVLAELTTLQLNGISVQKWESIGIELQQINAVCNATHYITTNKWSSSECKQSKDDDGCQQFVLVDVNCHNDEEDSDFSFKAEFFGTKNFITNPEIFQQPPGVYCENKKSKVNFPALPKYFAFDFETYDPTNDLKNKETWNFHQSIWIDEENKVMKRNTLQQNFEITYSQIGDYNNRIIYSEDKKSEKFNIWSMGKTETMEQNTMLPIDTFPLFPQTSNEVPQYVGKRRKHGLNFDVWVNQKENDDYMVVSDYYFLNETGLENTQVTYLSPVFIETRTVEEGKVITTTWQMINKYRTHPVEWSVFDITDWFEETDKLRLILSFTGSNAGVTTNELTENMRSNLLKLLKISPLRLGVPQIVFFDDKYIKYFLTITEQPYKVGYGIETKEPSLNEVYENLKQNVMNGDFKFTVKKGNVLKAVDVTKGQNEGKESKSKSTRFSGGALAGVGIAMLALGTLQGIILLTAYVRYKKANNIIS